MDPYYWRHNIFHFTFQTMKVNMKFQFVVYLHKNIFSHVCIYMHFLFREPKNISWKFFGCISFSLFLIEAVYFTSAKKTRIYSLEYKTHFYGFSSKSCCIKFTQKKFSLNVKSNLQIISSYVNLKIYGIYSLL